MNNAIPLARMVSASSGTLVPVDAFTGTLTDPQPRYDVAIHSPSAARIEFTYDGVTDTTVQLGDGSTRQQIGMAIRCMNECNGLYAMWIVADDASGAVVPRLLVQRKTNPGQVTFAECNGNNYVTIVSDPKPDGSAYPAPGSMSVGSKHYMDIAIIQDTMKVSCDGIVVFSKQLTAAQSNVGPSLRIRADNFKTTFSAWADTYVPFYPVARVRCCGLR